MNLGHGSAHHRTAIKTAAVRSVRPGLAGVVLAVALAIVARMLSWVLPSLISEVTIGIILGLIVGNVMPLPADVYQGAKFAVGTPLRLGIVLMGARLSLGDVLGTGVGALVLIVGCMLFALGVVMVCGRVFGVPMRLAVLIAVGTAVCGNSAIIATAPVIEAEHREVSFAVATITLFGILAVLLYPLFGHALGLSDRSFGHWAGVAVNDTSQVTAAGFAYSPAAGEIATIVKLTRNVLMAPLIIIIGTLYLHSGRAKGADAVQEASRLRFLHLLPVFVVGFVAMAALNSVGWIPLGLTPVLSELSKGLILVALVSVGLSTRMSLLRAIGLRPMYVGFFAAGSLSLFALLLGSLILG